MTQDDLFLSLLGSPAAAGLARTLVAQRLHKWNLNDFSDDALLIASELVANAVEAAPNRELKLHLTRDREGILLQIWDPSPGHPTSNPVTELTLDAIDRAPAGSWDHGGGWGLPIVEALSSECGYRLTPPIG